MKKIALLLSLLFVFVSCTPLMKYEPPKFDPPPKLEPYKMPADPFAGTEPPKSLLLCKLEDGKFQECPKNEATIVAYSAKEHDKIVLRLQYYKEVLPTMERMINVYIELNNAQVRLVIDERLAKELYKQLFIDVQNKAIVDDRWDNLQKGGLWAIILGQLVAIIATGL